MQIWWICWYTIFMAAKIILLSFWQPFKFLLKIALTSRLLVFTASNSSWLSLQSLIYFQHNSLSTAQRYTPYHFLFNALQNKWEKSVHIYLFHTFHILRKGAPSSFLNHPPFFVSFCYSYQRDFSLGLSAFT